MRKILLFASLMLALSSCDSKSYRVKSGTAITIDGDTIEFYGGTITYPFFGQRSIREIVDCSLKPMCYKIVDSLCGMLDESDKFVNRGKIAELKVEE